MAARVIALAQRYHSHFQSVTRNVADAARDYLCGLFQAPKKNMERMEEVVPDADEQQLQHFLSQSPWEAQDVMAQVAQEADALLGGHADSSLLLDESAFSKKGSHSVGVARQYNGRLGKVDNCQVGVFAALSHGDRVSPVGGRLYLSKGWTRDRARCRAAGVPPERFKHQTKQVLALELVVEARQRGVRFQWVQSDSGYGHDAKFCQRLAALEERFLVGVPRKQRIYLEDPQPAVPAKGRKPGRTPTRLRAQVKATSVEKWAKRQPKTAWRTLDLRDTTKGKLEVEVLERWVWVWDGKSPHAQYGRLVVERDAQSGTDYKYALSNAGTEVSWEQVATQMRQRYWIERAFEDGKSQVGWGDYQARGWVAWHHHMALVMMAMLFLVQERGCQQAAHPLISCTDVVEWLGWVLPHRKVSPAELLRQMTWRHAKRQASIDAAYRKQQARRAASGSA
jgi:SRSO17 transposase